VTIALAGAKAAVGCVDVVVVCDKMGHQPRLRFLPSEKGKEAMEPTVTEDGSAKGDPLVLYKSSSLPPIFFAARHSRRDKYY
jgi:hypothetical protein